MYPQKISAIIPTIGRPKSLSQLLGSLAIQTQKPDEIIVADGSNTDEIKNIIEDTMWSAKSLTIKHIKVQPPNAVRQRQAAIAQSQGEFLLLLDDDVVLEQNCVAEMLKIVTDDQEVVGVMADFNNQNWSMPTTAWKLYLKYVCKLKEDQWQGKVVGPLLRFGYNPSPNSPMPIEWLGAGNSMIRRSAYDKSGGFSDFFLHRCTMNEDVDLGIKLSKTGKIIFCPSARLAHFHAPSGRVSPMVAAEDDLYNRFMILNNTVKYSGLTALWQVLTFFVIESISNFVGGAKRFDFKSFSNLLIGRLNGIKLIINYLT
ncbi:hypothetical protein AWQ21_10305 [Picosynechococcus sp. PCC 7003]|uniref:glycosyltransferase family 2 protein n=1 Tax=Picosynechococcus sp. PCC 7003 TaxID=374981 RepID=UPI0008109F5E|nr:glycosyltransferase [Picosynechococcus sp. PCC 7003]ANV84734.1 hypothetical protein AWQ21_10305 [Picosynechococcus sp. PCC 7003]